ncbi:MAG: DNA translocase FtsK [Phycisphaerales bacterium]|jgi:S-DNA-T family DNA segregation ATPase FtsK/SpoIIIE|nr:DNA translocase FtsK [Phycisphaerales bacterium]
MARTSKTSVRADRTTPKGRGKGSSKKGGQGSEPSLPIWRKVLWLGLLTAWAFIALSLLGFDAADPPSHTHWPANDPVHNWCGPVGAYLAYHMLRLMGWGVWLPTLILGWGILRPILGHEARQPILRTLGAVMLTAGVCGFLTLLFDEVGPLPELSGGTLGLVVEGELATRFGTFGTGLWLALLTFVAAIVVFDDLILSVPRAILSRAASHVGSAAQTAREAAKEKANEASHAAARAGGSFFGRVTGGIAGRLKRRSAARVRIDDIEDDQEIPEKPVRDTASREDAARVGHAAGRDESARGRRSKPERPAKQAEIEREPIEDLADEEEELDTPEVDTNEDADLPGAPQVFDKDALRAKISKLPVRFAAETRQSATEADLRDLQGVGEMEGYRFPGLDQLEAPEENFSQKLEQLVRGQAEALEAALKQYRIDGEVVGIESGPVITQYDVRLAPGTKVAALTAVSSDVARHLRAVNIRIVPNQAGRDTVGVEVPNPTKEKVRLKELMGSRERFAKMRLPMFLGKDASGEPLIEDLTKMPHMLIAGTTGSGKSVCINTIIMGFLYTKKPNELKLVLVDPKMVEMSQFRDIPHLMCPVVTEMGKAAAILEWAVRKMDERYELLAEAGCRDITTYNELGWDELKERFRPASPEEEARIPRRLPYMVFIIDELADLMMTNKEVEGSIIRIAQKARAVGIHLILATQRPQANVVTGLIKSNMPCRIAFKVASGMDSRIVLDQKGGELLLGQGDMLVLSPTSHKLMRAQGTLVDDHEIRRVVKFMREVATPTFERQLVQLRSGQNPDEERLVESQNNSSASLAAAQEDALFDRAVEIVLETRRGSVSLLQRRLAIGYTRASRLIDLMGIAGIISDHKGSVARDVLITPEEWEAMKELVAEEAEAQKRGGQRELFDPNAAANGATAGGATVGVTTREDAEAIVRREYSRPAEQRAGIELDDMDEFDAMVHARTEEPPFETDAPRARAMSEAGLEDAEEAEAEDVLEEEDTLQEEDVEDEIDEDDTEEDEGDEEVTEEDELAEEAVDEEEEDEGEEDAEAEDSEEGDEDSDEEYVYVDEDGNEIDPSELEDYEFEDADEEDSEEEDEEDESEDDAEEEDPEEEDAEEEDAAESEDETPRRSRRSA